MVIKDKKGKMDSSFKSGKSAKGFPTVPVKKG